MRVFSNANFCMKKTLNYIICIQKILKTIKSGRTPDGQVFNPLEAALLEPENLAVSNNLSSVEEGNGVAEVSLVKYESRKIEFKAHNTNARFLVLSEVFYPGWKALIDKTEVEVYRTNYALRGIKVPPGEHKIELLYEPASFKLGAGISGFGVIFLLVILVLNRRYPR